MTTSDGVVPVPRERLLHDWRGAHERATRYLRALGVTTDDPEPLASRAVMEAIARPTWSPDGDACSETLRALRRMLAAPGPGADPEATFLAWRVERLFGRAVPTATPPIVRAPMQANRIVRGRIVPAERPDHVPARPARRQPWVRAARRRRTLLGLLVLLPTVIASGFMIEVLPHEGAGILEALIVLVFGALFGWISIGFWTALSGFALLVGRPDRFAITRAARSADPIAPDTRTALVMPICDEPVGETFAGLRAVYESLMRTGHGDAFDFFVLSDSRSTEAWVGEEAAWLRWCRASGTFGHVFYRHRRAPVARKSGNVADFCRRWGRRYRYMIMLDADSRMTGDAVVRLVQLMEASPRVGLIQTAPVAARRRTLIARAQQFAGRVYGPMFAAGLHFWQLGDGQYWGHNAIIRVAPFMEHCGLPTLAGRGPLGGEILSHDFVEAALMARAGWELWLAYDLPGSYEEIPSSLLEELRRDQRWCQGNLQHLRLLLTPGLFAAHRALFLNGVFSYVSAFLWLGFLLLSTGAAIREAVELPDYFPSGPSLFPAWPIWRPDWVIALVVVTALILFLPKLLGLVLVLARGKARAFGGAGRLVASVVLEALLASLFAPIRMAFHSRFVVRTLLGRPVTWRSQPRGDAETSWTAALRHHGVDTLVATTWGLVVHALSPDYFWWLTPVVGALVLSVPLSVLASRVRWGDRARAAGLFLIPEETDPPAVLRDASAASDAPEDRLGAFAVAVADPEINALHRVLLRNGRSLAPAVRSAREAAIDRAVRDGPAALTPQTQRTLLLDPTAMDTLHRQVWDRCPPAWAPACATIAERRP